MQLTREADYAIRIMLEVARPPVDLPTSTAQISRQCLVPRPILRKIVPRLVSAGLVHTRRGSRGGLLLARPAEEIHLLAIIQAAEGPIAINRCVLRPEACSLQPTCPVHEVCRMARGEIARVFSSAHLADLIRRSFELRAAASTIASDQPSPQQPR